MPSSAHGVRFLRILGALLCISSVPLYGSGSGSAASQQHHHPAMNRRLSAGAVHRHSGYLHQGMSSSGIDNKIVPLLNALNPPCSPEKNHMGFLVLRGGGNLVKKRAKEARAKMKDRMSKSLAIRKKSGAIAKKARGSRATVAEYIQVCFTGKHCMLHSLRPHVILFACGMFSRDQLKFTAQAGETKAKEHQQTA
jgi:hypothetical protein